MNLRRPADFGRAILVLAVCVIILAAAVLRLFNSQELFFYDLRFLLRGPIPVSDKIVIIQISDDTLKSLGQWPLPRDFHASLTEVLKSLGARAIVFDLLLSEPSEQDEVLSEAFSRAGCVYLPLAFYQQAGESQALLAGIAPGLESHLAGEGHINVAVDPDGKNRRIPLFIRSQGSWIPPLSLKVACDVLGIDLTHVVFLPHAVVVDNRLTMPVSRQGFWVNYPGLWKDTFRHISYYDLLKAFKTKTQGGVPSIDLSSFKDKVCFVGLTATGTSDFRANPLESAYPMVGLQASVFNSVLENRFIREADPLTNAALALVLFLVSLAISLSAAPWLALLFNVILTGVVFSAEQMLFSRFGLWFDFFFPALVIFSAYVGSLFLRFLKEARERQILEKELEIARTIQSNFLPRDMSALGGVRVSALMEPAKFVAGDLYDVVVLDGARLAVLIGDVSGKGVPASLIMAQTVSLFRIFARQMAEPADVFTAMNKELVPLLQGRFVTGTYLLIDTQSGTLRAACAGHFPLMIYRAAEKAVVEMALESGPPLGIVDQQAYRQTQVVAGAGDRVLLYTDGVTEARRGREEFGGERLRDFMKKNAGHTGEQMIRSLAAALVSFQNGSPQHDDITLVAVDIGAQGL